MTEPDEMPSLAEFAPDPFAQKLDRLRWLFSQMGAAFGVERQVLQEERRVSRERDPASYEEWEHLIFDDQEYDLDECNALRAGFILVSMAEAVRELLKEAKSEVKQPTRDSSTVTAKGPDGKEGKKSRGDCLAAFRKLFLSLRIDLTGGPGWDRVQEIVAARNFVQHPESLENYRRCHGNPRYLEAGELRLTQAELEATLNQLQDFAGWLRSQIREPRRKTGTE